VVAPSDDDLARSALDTERHFVLTLGGFALEIAGAVLVTHERIPSPRFNFVQVGRIAPERQSAFFERSLDHYFQRAIRPTFRVRPPVPPHLDRGLRQLGLRPRSIPLELRVGDPTGAVPPGGAIAVHPAEPEDLDTLAAFWTIERERPEFRAAFEVAWSHPNPGEELRPFVAESAGGIVAAALVYRHGSMAGVYAVATQPGARGQGAASELVRHAAADSGPGVRTSIFADSPRLGTRLDRLGFRVVAAFQQYELPPDASLAIPTPGPPGPARWRPPRP
jgi:GNAT superfamily N-acetyltransferase